MGFDDVNTGSYLQSIIPEFSGFAHDVLQMDLRFAGRSNTNQLDGYGQAVLLEPAGVQLIQRRGAEGAGVRVVVGLDQDVQVGCARYVVGHLGVPLGLSIGDEKFLARITQAVLRTLRVGPAILGQHSG
jgi:hypothetical protein